MKWLFLALLSVSVVITIILLVKSDTRLLSIGTSVPTETNMLVVLPQLALDTRVVIKQVDLPNSGFLVVRSVENSRLSQIIEISTYLTAGEHANITIDLGEFYDGAADLVVVAYEDAENDQLFNDLDQPMVTTNNTIIARYVKTGEEVSSELFMNTGKPLPHIMGGVTMETIRYTNQGFVPAQLTVTVGTVVQFVNESDAAMWVASNEHPGHTDLPTFDQFSPSEKTSTYTYTFDQRGTWTFHDHLQPTFIGVIKVM